MSKNNRAHAAQKSILDAAEKFIDAVDGPHFSLHDLVHAIAPGLLAVIACIAALLHWH
jgi:hypothetical protein